MSDQPKTGGAALDREVNVRAVTILMVALAVIIAVPIALMWGLANKLTTDLEASDPPLPVLPAARQAWEPPTPRLQTDPEGELRALRADETRTLGRLEWIDPQSGLARIPIEDAMALVAELGTDGVGLGPASTGAAAPGTAAEVPDTGEAATP